MVNTIDASDKIGLILVTLSAFVLCYALFTWMQFDYLLYGYLYYDDNHLISMASLGGDLGRGLDRRGYTLLGTFNSIQVIQFAVLAFIAGTTAIMAGILYGLTRQAALSVGASLFIVSYPFAVDQGAMYITATHPFYGAIWSFAALAAFWSGWKSSSFVRFLVGIFLGVVFAFLAVPSSPTARLMIAAPLLWLVVLSLYRWPGWRRGALAMAVVILITLAFYWLHGIPSYHYASSPGRVDYSAAGALGNLWRATELIVAPIFEASRTSFWLYTAGFAAVATATMLGGRGLARTRRPERLAGLGASDVAAFGALCLITAALVFGPGSVVTFFRPRYAVPSFLFAATAVAVAAIWLAVNGGKAAVRASIIGMIALLVANVLRGDEMRDRVYAQSFETHKHVKALVEKERERWPTGAQVVILYSKPSATAGFNHWSTWYLRALSGDVSLIGLVGMKGWLEEKPFVEEYSDHGPDYRVMRGGRSVRLRMKGLEYDRPLYLYEFEKDGFVPKDVVFVDSSLTMVAFGTAPSAGASGDMAALSCSNAESPVFWISDIPESPQVQLREHGSERSFSFDGSQVEQVSISVDPGTYVELSFRLRSHGEPVSFNPFSDTRPEMPLLSNVLRVFRASDELVIADRRVASEGGRAIRVPEGGEGALVTIKGVEGCFLFLEADEVVFGRLAASSLSGDWRLGAGNRERFWHGEITEWRLMTSPELPTQSGRAMLIDAE